MSKIFGLILLAVVIGWCSEREQRQTDELKVCRVVLAQPNADTLAILRERSICTRVIKAP